MAAGWGSCWRRGSGGVHAASKASLERVGDQAASHSGGSSSGTCSRHQLLSHGRPFTDFVQQVALFALRPRGGIVWHQSMNVGRDQRGVGDRSKAEHWEAGGVI